MVAAGGHADENDWIAEPGYIDREQTLANECMTR